MVSTRGLPSNNVDPIELKMTLAGQGKGCFHLALKVLIGSAPVTVVST
jgi:hypothetical protein